MSAASSSTESASNGHTHVPKSSVATAWLETSRRSTADPATAELMSWLDLQAKRNLVLTFGGGVNEIQRELIASAGLGLPRVPR